MINFTLYGFLFVLSLYFQHARGYSPEQTGFAFLPLSVAVGFANVFAGWLMSQTGPRPPLVWGLSAGALGFVLLAPIGAHTAYGLLLPSFLLISCGVGTAVPAMTTALLATVHKTQAGIGLRRAQHHPPGGRRDRRGGVRRDRRPRRTSHGRTARHVLDRRAAVALRRGGGGDRDSAQLGVPANAGTTRLRAIGLAARLKYTRRFKNKRLKPA